MTNDDQDLLDGAIAIATAAAISEPSARVRGETRRERHYVVLCVTDTGTDTKVAAYSATLNLQGIKAVVKATAKKMAARDAERGVQ